MATFPRLTSSPRSWLQGALGLFPDGPFESDALEIIHPREIPEPEHRLLVHHQHMTVTLEDYYGAPVHLHALDVHEDSSTYARTLYLTAGAHGPAVMAGVLHIWVEHFRADVLDAIRSRTTPFGRILIDHDVMRRLETVTFLKTPVQARLGKICDWPKGTAPAFGRLALIFCHGKPAVELLEVVAPHGAVKALW